MDINNIAENTIKLLSEEINLENESKLYNMSRHLNKIMGNVGTCEKSIYRKKDEIKITELFCKIEKTVESWENIWTVLKHGDITYKKICDFLIYWIYDKLKNVDFKTLQINKFYTDIQRVIKKDKFNHICFNILNNEFYRKYVKAYDRKVIKNKKELYEFLEYYNLIKKRLEGRTSNQEHYCNYVKHIFDVYEEMYDGYISKGLEIYYKEILLFQEIFKEKNKDLQFVEKNCPNRCLNLVFNKNNKSVCSLSMKKHEINAQEGKKTFEIPKTDDFLKNLALYRFYEELYTAYDFNNDTFICSSMQKNTSKNSDFRVLCNNLNLILYEWTGLLNQFKTHLDENECCNYLNYWLHEKLIGHPFRKNITKMLYIAWDLMNTNNSENIKCSHKNFDVNENQFKKKKKLYDFLGYYKDIKSILSSKETLNTKQYCDYIKNNFGLYSVMKHEDMCNKSSAYNDELTAFKKVFITELNNLKLVCPGRHFELLFKDESNRKTLEPSYAHEILLQNNDYIMDNSKTNFEITYFEELPSYKKYEELNKHNNIDKYCGDCKEILILEKDTPGIYELCKKAIKNLREVIKKENCNEWGEYFIYWIHDEKGKIIRENKINNIENYMVKLFDVFYRIMDHLDIKNCIYYYNSHVSLDKWKEMKNLHDYFKNYSTISSCVSDPTKNNCHIYCNYVNYISEIYKKNLKECCIYYYGVDQVAENRCPSYFICDKENNPYTLLSKLECVNHPSREEVDNIYDEATIDRNVKLISERYNKQSNKSIYVYEASNSESEYDSFHVIMLTAFVCLGIFFTFFVFYKFTPLGICINRKILKKNRITNKYENRFQNIQKNKSKNSRINPQSLGVLISYQSV
ncbi:variable surface protein [Plasmodium gonderi]|uniref:Variable surface protein n=1 Tax=Plasmodium gonderi TaxID=77519 RepID=A0A1Y1JEF7_PLAGO|nr:variable surface protein [Plasmodium gonderi]GAW79597.1 variable surface protein [Plasmodium gonderi]